MLVTVHSKFVRRVSAACLGLWVVAFVTCSLHCTIGNFSVRSAAGDHSCCAKQSTASDTPSAPVASNSCSTFRELALNDAAAPRLEFTPQILAVLVPCLADFLASPTLIEVPRLYIEPDSGPPSHIPLMRLAGRAPPTLV